MGSAAPAAIAIVFSAAARKELAKIWDYNADFYDSNVHADKYIDFLISSVRALSTDPQRGRAVETNPSLRYLVMKRNPSGDGHIAVYRVTKNEIRIVHVFHTSQNWQTKVKPRKL